MKYLIIMSIPVFKIYILYRNETSNCIVYINRDIALVSKAPWGP